MDIATLIEKDGPAFKFWNSAWIGVPLWIAFAALNMYWFARTPLPGKAIGVLAVVAGIMSVRDMKVLGKFIWVVLLISLLLTEFRAIGKDRTGANTQATADRKTQDDDFAKVLKSQDIAFGQVLNAQNQDFAQTATDLTSAYKLSQRQFNTTLGTLVKSHKEDEKEFSGVLDRQNRSFEKQQELSEQVIGRLVPGDSATPHNACSANGPKSGDFLVITGDSADITRSLPHTIIMVGKTPVLSVSRVENTDNIAISVDMRDQLNRIAFRIDENGVVNRSNLIALHPDKSTLLVQNEYGEEVFRARFLNPKAISVTGRVGYCGHLFQIESIHGYCSVHNGIGIAISAASCPLP